MMRGQFGIHEMVEAPRDTLVGPTPLPLCSAGLGERRARSLGGGRFWLSLSLLLLLLLLLHPLLLSTVAREE